MPDNDKKQESTNSFEGKEIKNTMPQLDDEVYDQINKQGNNIRNNMDDDFDDDMDSDNEGLLGSMLEFAKNASAKETKTSKHARLSDDEDDSETKVNKGFKDMFGFGKKKKQGDEVVAVVEEEIIEDNTETSHASSINDSTNNDTMDDSDNDFDEEDEDIVDSFNSKKSGLFGKKSKQKNGIVNSDGDYIHINSMEEMTKTSKPSKINTKAILIVVIVFAIIAGLTAGGIFIFQNLDKIMSGFKQLNPPEIEIVPTPEVVVDEFETDNSDEVLYKQGKIKRILGNKVIIIPDGETENSIYYVDDIEVISNFKAGNYIEFSYSIKNYLPYIDTMIEIREGVVAYKGIMTINIVVDNALVKFAYDKTLAEDIKEIEPGDSIQYVYEDVDGVMTITSIINIVKSKDLNQEETVIPGQSQETTNNYNEYVYNEEDFYNEHAIIDARPPEEDGYVSFKTHLEDNSISFYVGLDGPVWIRHAWRSSNLMDTVPSVESVGEVLVLPDGTEITAANIADYGRMWVDGHVIHYALKEAPIGEYKIVANKPDGTYLGETMIHVMSLTGFITIDKFGANLIDRENLELIWNIGGVPDDGLEIEVYLTNDRFSSMIYSASSKDGPLHIIDSAVVSVANIPKGKYNVIVNVKDLDIRTSEDSEAVEENTIVIAAETIKDSKNIGTLVIQ